MDRFLRPFRQAIFWEDHFGRDVYDIKNRLLNCVRAQNGPPKIWLNSSVISRFTVRSIASLIAISSQYILTLE